QPAVVGSAYSNNFDGGPPAALYGIDATADTLVVQSPEDAGTLVTVGPLGVDTSSIVSFDIGQDGDAYAVLTVGGQSRLYTIDLNTGAATLVSPIGITGPLVTGLAVAP